MVVFLQVQFVEYHKIDDILGRRHPGVRQHRPPLRLAGRLLPRRDIWTASVRRRGPTPRSTRSGTAGQQCPDKVHWPTELGPRPALYFNAGMFVYEPSLSVYDDLLTTLKITPPTPFAEQVIIVIPLLLRPSFFPFQGFACTDADKTRCT